MASWGDYALTGPWANSGYIQSFLHPENAYNKAGEAENAGWNEAKNYQDPFWQGGKDQYGRLNQATGDLMDPQKLQDQWSKGYEQSPYAQQLLSQNKTSGLDAASSMGLMGSSAAMGNIQQGAGQIVAKDRQQYMDDMMKKYMAGIGLGQNLYGIGAQTGQNLGQQSMTHGENQAGLQYGASAAPGKLFGQAIGTALNFFKPGAGNAFTGQGGNQFNSNQSGYFQ
jgi:hypothetical protein